MTMKRELCSAAVLVVWIAGQALAWDTSRNPDRWTEVGMQVTGGGDIGADISSTHKGIDQTASQPFNNLEPLGELLVPLSNNLSVRASLAGSFNQSSRDQSGTLDAIDSNSKSLDYTTTLRYYFLDRHLTSEDISQNPDQWPSANLAFDGSNRVGYDTTNTFNGVDNQPLDNDLDDGFSHTYGVSGGIRLPVSNHWTWNANLGASFNDYGNPGAANVTESETRTDIITASAGPKYYFVGHNLIAQDNGKNPDRWISLATTVNGTISANGEQDNSFNGVETDRSADSHSLGFTSELRLPVANALTLRLGITGNWGYSNLPETGNYSSYDSYSPSVTGLIGLRYFFE
jgi:hypothetical protein